MHAPHAPADPRYAPDGAYANVRLGVSLLAATLLAAGMWSIVVVMPKVQADFGVARATASMPYTLSMVGFAAGAMVLGRWADRIGIVLPLCVSAALLAAGFVIAGMAPGIEVFAAAHLLIGFGAAVGFGPLIADISHWFVRRLGLAVVVVASGNYVGGAVWPLVLNQTVPAFGWRHSYIVIGLAVAAVVLPLSLALRRRPAEHTFAAAAAATAVAQANLGLSVRTLMTLLSIAGVACCVAMSMPQVHIVAYCSDLGYGVARGAEMLSLMLFLGIFSRVASGYVSDRIGGAKTLLIGSVMQGVALLLYLFFDGLTSLYVVSGVFGLFQGGIVPMYAVICRELLPPREAGARIGVLVTATIVGMAFGGYFSGLIFDWTGSYGMAFLNGVLWNAVNVTIVGWLVWKQMRQGGAIAQSA
ncbi:MAG: MFS transporter [Methylobacteriaceae bacterium]|nr:MFS transporter [Rhodoblastus sp.]MCC0003838.1 MFS transporter [Methylobacteriaceae bacterium]